jgi:hypothetical protein
MNARPQQFVGFWLTHRELAEYLKLPRDHRVVLVETNKLRYGAPGVLVIVEGPAGYLAARGAAVAFHAGLEEWRTDVDEIREASLKLYGPYEWEYWSCRTHEARLW